MTRRLGWALLALVAAACAPDVAEVGPQRLLPSQATASIGNETRLALILKPPHVTQRRFEVLLPPNAGFAFGFGIPNASLAKGARAATFAATLESGDGTRRPLVERRVDPAVPTDQRWFDIDVDLSSLAGERVVLEFAMSASPGAGEPPLGAFADPVLYDRGRGDAPTNVLVLSIDTLRSRNVGAYGYARETSPYLDELAASGALFEQAITTSVTTGPSHMSLFTGLYPVNHGLRTGLEYKADRVATLAGALRAGGYQTAAFTENGYIVRTRGFGDGFSEYTENRGSKRTGPGEVRVTFSQARQWLEQSAREPFYLFVHTYQVHAPYRPPKAYEDLFSDDALPGPKDPALLRQRDNYDREIRFVDDKLRELVSSLEEKGLRERTLLVIVSDHGEEFHEHGLYQHGGAVFEESIRIPMIFVGPGVPVGRHASQVSLIDVLPTVLDYVGQPVPPEIDGLSLLPAMQQGDPLPERTLFAEANAKKRWLRPFKGEAWSPPLIAARTRHEKFIVHRPGEGEAQPPVYYDLRGDPTEVVPLTLSGEKLARVDALIDGFLASRLSDAERPKSESPEEIDPALRERLRLLGYVEGDPAP